MGPVANDLAPATAQPPSRGYPATRTVSRPRGQRSPRLGEKTFWTFVKDTCIDR